MAETILVVDDDPDIARFVEVNLRSAGYDVAVAGDGEAALEQRWHAAPRSRAARRDDASARRVRGRPAAAQEPPDGQHEHHHADREGALGRQGDRPAVGRRRLHHQAVRPDRAAGPRQGHAAPGQGDAQPLAAHRSAGQHPYPGRDRASGSRGAAVRRAVLRPRQLQGLQRPEGVRARRPPDPGDGAHHPGRRASPTTAPTGSSATSVATTSSSSCAPEIAEPVAKSVCDGVRRAHASSSTRPTTSSAGSCASRTARACCRTSRSWPSRSASRRAPAGLRALRRGGVGRDRDEAVRQARAGLLLRDRPAHHLTPASSVPGFSRAGRPALYSPRSSSFPGRGATPHRR